MSLLRSTAILCLSVLVGGCATPRAIRSLSAAQLKFQKNYELTLRDYFTAIERFGDAQVSLADFQIDQAAAKIENLYKLKAVEALANAGDGASRQKVIDQLAAELRQNDKDTASNKTKIAGLFSQLKDKDAQLLRAYSEIILAQEKLDTYIQMKKADEVVLDSLINTVGINQQKIIQTVAEIGGITEQISKSIPK